MNVNKFVLRLAFVITLLALHYIVFFIPLADIFLIYVVFFNPKWFRDFMEN